MPGWGLFAVASAIVGALLLPEAAGAGQAIGANCAVPPSLLEDRSPLPHASHAVARDRALKIVVLGSSSSAGAGATGPDAAWPVRLQAHLTNRLRDIKVQVINRSRTGEGTQQMVDRLAADVIPEKPSIVIWQTGTAEAVRASEIDRFISTLVAGVDKLEFLGSDVVLMDQQYSRATVRMINFQPYVDALHQVAGMRDLVLVPRYAIMRYWSENGQFHFSDLTRARAAQVADEVYDCIGQIVAYIIAAKLEVPK